MASSPSPSPETLSRVSVETIGRAVDPLLKWIRSQSKNQKAQLLEHDEFLYLILTLKKIPSKARVNPFKLPLPHPLHNPSEEDVCLIIDDRSKSALTSQSAKLKLESDNIPVSKVLKVSKLKSDYRPFEAKRQLCSSYDLFFADKRVVPLLPKLLGKQFFKKKKIPVPIDLTRKNWKEQMEGVCGSALLYLRTGSCSVVKVARVSHGREKIVENVMAAIDGAAGIVPKKWENVMSIYLKSTESLALPVYQSVPTIGLKIDGIGKVGGEVGDGGEVEVGVVEAEKNEEKKKKKKKTGGRIHEVNLDEFLLGNVSGDDDEDDDKESEDGELGNAELTSKKRKKKDGALNDLKKQKKSVEGKRRNNDKKHKKMDGLVSEETGGEEEEASAGVEQKKRIKVGKMGNKKSKRVLVA